MAVKSFIDTNILLDIFDPLRPYHIEARQLFDHLDLDKFQAYYTESVITTFAYVIRKDFLPDDICQIVDSLNKKMILLPCSNLAVKLAAVKLPPDFEDALLYEIALHHQLDFFITSNTKDFKKIQVQVLPVLTAANFNKLLV
jgi:predicted nucleic acid-binding protein